jgi:ABC-type uncharacterized transport system substrate-binding protein
MAENHRRAASFVVKILRGQKPGDLPIELPVRLELVVNLKTTKTIELSVSEVVLGTGRQGNRVRSCDVAYWHETDMPTALSDVRFWV